MSRAAPVTPQAASEGAKRYEMPLKVHCKLLKYRWREISQGLGGSPIFISRSIFLLFSSGSLNSPLIFSMFLSKLRLSPVLMNSCRIAVGSKRTPKLLAVEEATALFAASLSPHAPLEIQGYEVESGVSHTPASREELMTGARQRTEALYKLLRDTSAVADYFVGLEGGLDVVAENGGRRVFLESWAYVSDGVRGHFGCSGSIELPDLLAEEVLGRGTELGVAIDRFAGAVGIRDGQGAWGVLTNNLIVRQESFRLAVLTAFAPFYNARVYRAVAAACS